MRKIEENNRLYIGAEIDPIHLTCEDKDKPQRMHDSGTMLIVTAIYPRLVTLKSTSEKDKETYTMNLGDLVCAGYIPPVR